MMVPTVGSSEAEGSQDDAGEAGVRLRWRRGQSLLLRDVDDDTAFRVEGGCLTCDAPVAAGRRHVLLVLFPGDVLCRRFVPPLPDLQMTSAASSVLLRVRGQGSDGGKSAVRFRALDVAAGAAQLLTRSCLYATARGRLSAEECLATLLADMALRLGRATPGGYAFDVPLSRRDMADYLALNPDSLSRMMSRFKQSHLIVMPTRTRAIAPNIDALIAATPFGETLRELAAARGRAAQA